MTVGLLVGIFVLTFSRPSGNQIVNGMTFSERDAGFAGNERRGSDSRRVVTRPVWPARVLPRWRTRPPRRSERENRRRTRPEDGSLPDVGRGRRRGSARTKVTVGPWWEFLFWCFRTERRPDRDRDHFFGTARRRGRAGAMGKEVTPGSYPAWLARAPLKNGRRGEATRGAGGGETDDG